MNNMMEESAVVGSGEEVAERLGVLEGGELDATLSPQNHAHLMALYLILNDLRHAQLLWKRLNGRGRGEEVGELWKVAEALWQKNFPTAFTILNDKEWSDNLKPYIIKLRECIRCRAVALVERAYSSIKASNFALWMNFSEQECLEFVKERGWEYDSGLQMFVPKKNADTGTPPSPSDDGKGKSLESNAPPGLRLESLTNYVSFLENF